MNQQITSCNKSLCKNCKYRLRRVFIPSDILDLNNMQTQQSLGEEDIIILNHCLLLDMSIDLETTIECSHFAEKEKDSEINLLKHDI